MWPWILVPFQHEWPFFFLGGLMIQGIPDTCRPLWAVCGTTRAKGSLEKGWNLNSYFTSIFSLIAKLSLCWQSCHPTFLNSFLIEKSLVLIEGNGSLQFFFHVLGHLPVEVPLQICVVHVLIHFGKFLLYV